MIMQSESSVLDLSVAKKILDQALFNLLAKSTKTEAGQSNKIRYLISETDAPFANLAYTLNRDKQLVADDIDAAIELFKQKQNIICWHVNEEEAEVTVPLLNQREFTELCVLDGLILSNMDLKIKKRSDVTIKPAQDKTKYKKLFLEAYDGASPSMVDFYTEQAFFNPVAGYLNYFAYMDDRDEPVGYGSMLYYPEHQVVLLCGSAVLPEYRKTGVYQQLLSQRLEVAASAGMRHALIQAVSTTSSPVCQKAGFKKFYQQCLYVRML